MKRKNENIELLIERFLDGRTTCAEERTLYDYFRTAQIPAEWGVSERGDALLRAWYRRMRCRCAARGCGGEEAERRPARQAVASSALRRRRMLPAVAASLVCTLAAATWVLLSSMPGGGETGSIYDGELCPLRRRILQRRGCAPRPDRHSHDACRDNGDQGREAAGTG